VILCLEHINPYAAVTPLFGIVGLMVMAFNLRPFWMIFWSSTYSIVVACFFLNPTFFHFLKTTGTIPDDLTPLVRTVTFCAGAALASMLNISLGRSQAKSRDLKEIIEKMPSPLIASDSNGRIHHINQAASAFLGLSKEEEALGSYFDLFAPKNSKGKTISDYLSHFESRCSGDSLALEFRGIPYRGVTQFIQSTEPPFLITIIERTTGSQTSSP
jgi:PAS domain S-box-containing protein